MVILFLLLGLMLASTMASHRTRIPRRGIQRDYYQQDVYPGG